jgi:hypothetical protein
VRRWESSWLSGLDEISQFNIFISVINATSTVKVVKVRFHEGKASAEVLDFNSTRRPTRAGWRNHFQCPGRDF